MNILIAEDHELVRSGLSRIILEEFNNATIAEAREMITVFESKSTSIPVFKRSMS